MPKNDAISPKTLELIRAQMSRRGFIAGAGGLSAAGLLAACGTAAPKVSGATSPTAIADTGGTVRWANWTLSLYYDSKTKK